MQGNGGQLNSELPDKMSSSDAKSALGLDVLLRMSPLGPKVSRADKRLTNADGEKIVRLRRSRGWSQEELARHAHVADRTVERAEGGRPIYIRTICEIAAALRIAPSELMIAAETRGLPIEKPPFVFISYSHVDAGFADGFSRRLEEADIPYFRDVKAIGWGEDISERVHQALEQATHLVVLLSPPALNLNGYRMKWDTRKVAALSSYPTSCIQACLCLALSHQDAT